MRLSFVPSLVIGLVASATAASNVPDELAVIGKPSQTLPVSFPSASGAVHVSPGALLNAKVTKNPPRANISELHIDSLTSYVFMMVDPDINTTNPLYVGLHTMIANLNTTSEGNHTTVAGYIEPQPPSGSPPHNYTLFLFEQPKEFKIPPKYDPYLATKKTPLNRINFPLRQFLKETGLKKPVAANWFREGAANSTATATATATASGSGTGSGTSSTPSSQTGGASRFGDTGVSLLAGMAVLGGLVGAM